MPLIFVAVGLIVLSAALFVGSRRASGASQLPAQLGAMAVLALGMVMAVASVIRLVPAGHVQVEVLFGKVTGRTLVSGPHIANPLATYEQMNVRVQIFNFTGEERALAPAADGAWLEIDTGFNWSLQAEAASRVYERLGPDWVYVDTLRSSARSAIRDAVAKFDWKAAATTRREELAEAMRQEFEQSIVDKLKGAGFSDADAAAAFAVASVELRRVQPPAEVLAAVAAKVAADEELSRQKTLTAIQEEAAKRRGKEGEGVKNFVAQLPDTYSPDQVAAVIAALAEREKAEAMLKAVESGQVSLMIMDGGPSAAIPAPAPRR